MCITVHFLYSNVSFRFDSFRGTNISLTSASAMVQVLRSLLSHWRFPTQLRLSLLLNEEMRSYRLKIPLEFDEVLLLNGNETWLSETNKIRYLRTLTSDHL